jgi:hypothetical protein
VAAEASTVVGQDFASTTVDPSNLAPTFASALVETLFLSLLTLSTPTTPAVSAYPASSDGQIEAAFVVNGLTIARCHRNLSAASWDPSAWTYTSSNTSRTVTLAFKAK